MTEASQSAAVASFRHTYLDKCIILKLGRMPDAQSVQTST